MRELGELALAMNIEERTDYLKKYEDLVEETKAEMELKKEKAKEVPVKETPMEVANNQVTDDSKKDTDAAESNEVCPRCGGELILRTAKKGQNSGNQFYGCSNFPKCRYIKNL